MGALWIDERLRDLHQKSGKTGTDLFGFFDSAERPRPVHIELLAQLRHFHLTHISPSGMEKNAHMELGIASARNKRRAPGFRLFRSTNEIGSEVAIRRVPVRLRCCPPSSATITTTVGIPS